MNAEATLREWLRDPAGLGDEDLIPPDAVTIERALRLWRALQARGWDEPLRVVPDGEGGIAFEWTPMTDAFRAVTLGPDGVARHEWYANRTRLGSREIAY